MRLQVYLDEGAGSMAFSHISGVGEDIDGATKFYKPALKRDCIVVGLEPTKFLGLFPELLNITGPVSDGNTSMELTYASKGVVIIQKDRSDISSEAEHLLSTVCPGDRGMIWIDTYLEKRGGTSNQNKNY